MRNYQTKLIFIDKIAGMFYSSNKPCKTLVIYGLGAPVVPDSGNLPDAQAILEFDVDLLVPDYIGYGRSDGIFTPENCIKTFINLYDLISEDTFGINHYENSRIKLHYEKIIFIGRSLGGTYLPLLPKYNKKINILGLIYPAVDNKSSGEMPPEESNDDFMRAMTKDGYHYLYRGINSNLWKKHLVNEDGLSPMDNIEYLKDTRLFIGHGKKDECINYKKSLIYFEKITNFFPENKDQFKLNLYPDSGHNYKTSNPACRDFLNWINIPKYK